MKKNKNQGIGFFEKYLTLWVVLCMIVGVLIGKYLPAVPEVLGRFEYANVSIPLAVLLWLMIYPMMMKVDFKSIKYVGKNPKGLYVTCITNWLIKPFTMFGIAYFFLYVNICIKKLRYFGFLYNKNTPNDKSFGVFLCDKAA